MKGLVILLVLVAIIAGSLAALLRESDADLVRLEDAIEATCDQASETLAEATRVLNPLRVVNPGAIPLDHDLKRLRDEIASIRALVDDLRESRPDSESRRATFLAERRSVRERARKVLEEAGGLVERARVLEVVLRDTKPEIHKMLRLMAQLAEVRSQVEEDAELPAELAQKLDQLQKRVGDTRQLAAEAQRMAMANAETARTINATAAAECAAVMQDLRRALEELGHVPADHG